MSSSAPLDHLVIVSERLEPLAHDYQRLGFSMTDASSHRELGTANRLIVLDDIYIELLGVPAQSPLRQAFGARAGLVAAAWRSNDAADLLRDTARGDLRLAPPVSFQRVVTEHGAPIGDASFTVTMLTAQIPAGLQGAFFCQHHTPGLIFRDGSRQHPNGVTALSGICVISESPRRDAEQLSRTFCASVLTSNADRIELCCGGRTWTLATPGSLLRRYPGFRVPPQWQPPLAAAVSLYTDDLPRCRRILTDAGLVTYDSVDGGFAVDPVHAGGVLLDFLSANAQTRGQS